MTATSGEAVRAAAPLTLEEKLLLAAIAYFLMLRAAYLCFAFPVADETYYWLWGRHLALSYYDHPPLQGWLQGLSYTLFGRSYFALRWMTIAALAGTFWIYSLVAKRIAGEAWRPFFLRSATVYLAAPLFGFYSTIAFHDYLLAFLVLSSGYLFICYFTDVERDGQGELRDLFAAALLLGLAALTKYNGAFLGIAVAIAVLVRPRLRPLLLQWQLYAGALIAIAVQAPVVIWNAQEGFASFAYQMGTRHGTTGFTGINVAGMKAFVGEALLMVSPFFVPVIVKFFWARQRNPFERIGKTIAIGAFWVSSLTCLYVANFSWVIWWWNIVAFVLIFPFAGRYIRGWLLGLHIGWGAVVSTIMAVSYVIVPVLALLGRAPAMETERSFGVEQMIETVLEKQAETGAQFIASNHYIVASQIAFVLDDPSIGYVGAQHYAFDDWTDQEARRGQDAIVVIEPHSEAEAWKGRFETITDLGEVRAERFGYVINVFHLYLGRGFIPPQSPTTK